MSGYDPLSVVLGLLLLSFAPFLLMIATSYLKIVVVLSLVRNALGVQQIPPAMVLNGLAVIFSVFIMMPVALDTMSLMEKETLGKNMTMSQISGVMARVSPPLQTFLQQNSRETSVNFFFQTAKRIWPENRGATLKATDLIILLPAFAVSELTRAFEIGFMLYLPFITIDIVISNILLAMGMMMVSPMTISLPFKLLLFVLLDGWDRIVEGLVRSYLL